MLSWQTGWSCQAVVMNIKHPKKTCQKKKPQTTQRILHLQYTQMFWNKKKMKCKLNYCTKVRWKHFWIQCCAHQDKFQVRSEKENKSLSQSMVFDANVAQFNIRWMTSLCFNVSLMHVGLVLNLNNCRTVTIHWHQLMNYWSQT